MLCGKFLLSLSLSLTHTHTHTHTQWSDKVFYHWVLILTLSLVDFDQISLGLSFLTHKVELMISTSLHRVVWETNMLLKEFQNFLGPKDLLKKHLLKMYISGPHPRIVSLKTSEEEPRNLIFNKLPSWVWQPRQFDTGWNTIYERAL
jgi:hypothetical protein